MDSTRNLRLVMIGPSAETRSSAAATVALYREHGLFERWPVRYLTTHGGSGEPGSALRAPLVTLRAVRDFGELLGEHRRVVLHAHTSFGAAFWRDALFASIALAARCPVILQFHGGGAERFYDGLGAPKRALFTWLLERSACVVVPHESQRAWLRGVARDAHVVCVPSPVAALEVKREEPAPNMILYLGRLSAAKGVFDLLDAVAALRATIPDVRLVCAGDGDRAAVARYAERLEIADAVKFTGWVGPSGKRALFESAAVFALPSYEEALPMSLLEALGAGVPAVATPVGALPDVVVDGVTGCLVAPGDTAGLRRALARLLVDRELAARMGEAARRSVRLRFAPDRVLPMLEDLYLAAGLRAAAQDKAMPDLKQAA
jgi:glycosyltransferase involved in cell wall biosynthesis